MPLTHQLKYVVQQPPVPLQHYVVGVEYQLNISILRTPPLPDMGQLNNPLRSFMLSNRLSLYIWRSACLFVSIYCNTFAIPGEYYPGTTIKQYGGHKTTVSWYWWRWSVLMVLTGSLEHHARSGVGTAGDYFLGCGSTCMLVIADCTSIANLRFRFMLVALSDSC